MRRFLAAAAVFLLLVCMVCPVSATTGASSMQSFASISGDGSCQVTVNITLHLDAVVEDMAFPLPANAQNITVNGSPARIDRSGNVLYVDLSRLVGSVLGNFTLSISYRLTDLVALNAEGEPELTLPLLSGFSYPIEKLEFSVSLPGNFENRPNFVSGYFQQDIEPSMTWQVSGNTVTGSIDAQLRDQETLTMRLVVTEEMFPGVIQQQWQGNFDNIAMWVLAAAAVLYWLILLRCAPLIRERCATPPEGFTAGQLGSILTGQGADLTMTVFTWAKLGYILIYVEEHGRVVLHKRMDMGNERSVYEQKLFNKLFGKRRMIDGTGLHYAQLCQAAAASSGNARTLYRRKNGSTRIFRFLWAGVGLFAGISLGSALSENAVLGTLLSILFCVLCAGASWLIQDWVKGLHLNGRSSLYLALVCGILWLVLALLAKDAAIAAAVIAGQFVAGLFAAYGGRRTESGRQLASQVLGLRQFFRTAKPQQVHRLMDLDADYFFSMIPAAMALGCGERFAMHFGKRRLGGCPYLTTGMDGHRTALEWYTLLKRTADSLNDRQKRLFIERLTKK